MQEKRITDVEIKVKANKNLNKDQERTFTEMLKCC